MNGTRALKNCLSLKTGAEVRLAARSGSLATQTSGLAGGFAQANLVILPREYAYDFLLFCQRNRKPCPLLEVTDVGSPVPRTLAPDADLRTDLPRYRVWEHGTPVAEPNDIRDLWRDDFVSFLIGCSFTFEAALIRAGLEVRHVELGVNVPMYRTNIACTPAGIFSGPLVVSMRPYQPADVERARAVTARYPDVHGAPVHWGAAEAIGITNLAHPDFGDPVPLRAGEIPVFWACGVTPQAAIMAARPSLAITHSPGCMLVTDMLDESLCIG